MAWTTTRPSGGAGTASAGSSSVNASARASPAVGSGVSLKMKPAPVNSNGYHPAAQIPLSAMKSAPLDITTVERRGRLSTTYPPPKKSRPHGLQEAPTYRPTEEEWRDPMEYMRKISPEAKEYGICKIIPPDSWNPDFAIDTEKFHFRTRKQELNSVEGSTRANLTYLDALYKFHKQQGNNPSRVPYVDKKPLDLYRLKKAVEARGGFDKVCKLKKWAEIGRDLGYSGKIMSSLSTSLKNSYQKWLCPYEEYLRLAKPGVHQRLELEYGGPLTPSPAPTPVKTSQANTPAAARSDSPARQATDALQAGLSALKKEGDGDTSMTDTPPAPAQSGSSGFTAINTGGFKAVNAGSGGGFTSVNKPAASGSDSGAPTPQRQLGSPLPSATNTPDHRSSCPVQGTSLKRQLSCDSANSSKKSSGPEPEDNDSSSRRSKRLKKGAVPTVAGSHMSQFRPSAPRVHRDDPVAGVEKCEHCGKGSDSGALLVCESCDNSYHGLCLDPPTKQKHDSGWNCPRCLVGDGQFGFEEGGLYSLRQFQQKAADFKAGYFEKKIPFDPNTNGPRPITEEDVEREFWRLVTDIEETVEVEYGADIHCTTHGSGFPTIEKHPEDPYSLDPWNLNNLPLHPESLFRHIKTDISGMTVPWVYVGMIFSTFCWHNEDHYAYSANYQHFGDTKTWYGIPGSDAEKFEAAMRDAVPELFETQPDLLLQLVTLLTPEQLKKAGVSVYAVDQRAGELVITFPQGYHAGFNHGFNFNEAVNFAPCDWEPYGLAGVERLQSFRRQPCFSHDELLWTAAEGTTSGALTIQTAKWLAPALERIHSREKHDRETLRWARETAKTQLSSEEGKKEEAQIKIIYNDEDVPEEEYQCSYCKTFSFLSRFRCLSSGKTLCLAHVGTYSCCDASQPARLAGAGHALIVRKSEEAMDAAHARVSEKARTPEVWEEKYEKLLDEEAIPSLKSLRNLLNEGEKIPYDLPSLPLLREFVDRCNEWVEEATNYTVRKQQNRRKNDRSWQSSKRKSISGASPESKDKDRDSRDVSNIYRLLQEAEQIGFDCPEILQLQERADAIERFQENARRALEHVQSQTIPGIEDLLEEGRNYNVDMAEVDKLSRVLDQMRWNEKARDSRGVIMTLDEVEKLIEDGNKLDIPPYNDYIKYYTDQMTAGRNWEKKARELISAEIIHYPQLEALSTQAQHSALPVTRETLLRVDQILLKQREAHTQIIDLTQRSRMPDLRDRPKYTEVCDIMKRLEELNSKPSGTSDLEREQKRHEDWMRQGKKLFGKSNAPLHILKSHLDHVLARNLDCFDIVHDKPRDPAEPASREPSPSAKQSRWEDANNTREVFCLCRRVEAGMMIECGICHEWYHGKCLKIARGKVKDDDKAPWTCPVCDHRVRIPRDAARPRLEDLLIWSDEISNLPFQPEEEEVLKQIIDNAQAFRDHIASYINPLLSSQAEAETQRFYLRKLEGAEVFLVAETNFFRQELHKWCHITNEPPPVFQESKSTRKPRPTKLQKLMAQHGVEDPDDLPEEVKGKANSLRRKSKYYQGRQDGSQMSPPATAHTPILGTPIRGEGHGFSVVGHSDPHGHEQDASSGRPLGEPIKRDAMDIDNGMIHPSLLIPGGPRVVVDEENMSLEDRLLRGQLEGLNLHSDGVKSKALELLRRTDVGRRRAEEIYGPGVWGGGYASGGGGGIGQPAAEAGYPRDVEEMFGDLTNQDEEARRGEDVRVMADELESERNGMDALLDGE
ncbi:related to regulator protein rum1 [Cephalotrichum gorgonifer]|uniref:Related to regulator protein rum1 n=1 Tax=Cephalotrichum gorgonifer TaxID=2041049 RepID=A0AAE8SYP0_9PEZI|nr:related to regulator protein rum1 [Cephalotrichum gorgonifer]